jgi:hypothetical protein
MRRIGTTRWFNQQQWHTAGEWFADVARIAVAVAILALLAAFDR